MNTDKNDILYKDSLYVVGYSKNDFYYVDASFTSDKFYLCTNDTIKNFDISNRCTDASFNDNSSNCMNNQLCKNKEYADKIESIVNSHLGSGENYQDVNKLYQEQYKKMINNGLSIAFVIFMIFYTNK